MVRRSLEKHDTPSPTPSFRQQYKAHMAKLGAKGGKIGGKRRLETMTPEERSAVALKAVRARWAKRKATEQP